MFGLSGFRQLLVVLGAQSLVILLFAVLLIQFSTGAVEAPAWRSPFATLLLLIAAANIFMVFIWGTLDEPVELLWSIKAKQRVRNWMKNSLFLGSGAGLVAAAVTLAVQTPVTGGALSATLYALAALSVLAPLAATSALLAGALARYRVMKKNTDHLGASAERDKAAGKPHTERIAASVSAALGSSSTSVRANPQGFAFAGITSKPWYDKNDLPWVKAFEAACDEIRKEAMDVLGHHLAQVEKYNYPGLDGDDWRAFKFVSRHEEHEDNIALCPVTAKLLKTVPGYPSFRDAMFSILAGPSTIEPHRDTSNVFLTMHLGLVTPGDGYMEVGGIRREWKAGEAMVFDSSYEHSAVNKSNETRIVLLVDFLHPEITEREAEWVASELI